MQIKLSVILLLSILSSGCSTQMIREGWSIRGSPNDAAKLAGYRLPVATKTANGDVVIEYDVRLDQYGAWGSWSSPVRCLGLQRLTNTVAGTALQPLTNLWMFGTIALTPAAGSDAAFVPRGQKLPIVDRKLKKAGLWSYPAVEGMIDTGDWLWYVPPRDDSSVALGAILSQETKRTPAGAIAAKVLLLPFAVAGDIIYSPLYLCIYLGGEL